MDSEPDFPLIAEGDWFQTVHGDLLEVVASDESDGSIEVQYFDGTVEELDIETWYDLISGPAAAPEDWTGPLDLSHEDAAPDGDAAPIDRRTPGDYIDRS